MLQRICVAWDTGLKPSDHCESEPDRTPPLAATTWLSIERCVLVEMTVSVIIATCNRCESPKGSFGETEEPRISDHQMKCEILVVDNNSTDSTRQVLDDYLSCENPVFRYAFEKKQGKSYALNTGVREADGEILVFTDDDCIVDQF